MPRSLREKSKKLEETTEMLEQKHGRYVTEEEVAMQMNVTTAEVRKVSAESFFANVLSMDEESAEGDKSESFKVAIRDEKTLSPEDLMMKDASIQELAEVIQSLTEKKNGRQSVLYREMTLTEIGEIMSLPLPDFPDPFQSL
ncbi:sigma-70 domain-containing protein [Sinobaca sp. H24]|uniref:sigma-70 domain-containing protein n=1 Tax=Sinobaca sp. H24 TaxID=2923376 RepID=UPI0027E39D56|nr:sigma-70 domain-containing protein [Sinobaca sp. H24]